MYKSARAKVAALPVMIISITGPSEIHDFYDSTSEAGPTLIGEKKGKDNSRTRTFERRRLIIADLKVENGRKIVKSAAPYQTNLRADRISQHPSSVDAHAHPAQSSANGENWAQKSCT